MKKMTWIILIVLAIFDLLFYKQNPGTNCIVLTMILITVSIVRNPALKQNRDWIIIAAATFYSSLCVGYYGDNLSVLTNLIAISLLSAFLLNSGTSVLTALSSSVFSYLSSPYYLVKSVVVSMNHWQMSRNNEGYVKIGMTALSIAVVLIFFFIYRNSSLMFYELTQKINLDFISFFWIVFTCNGFLLLYSFFNFRRIKFIHKIIDNPPITLQNTVPEPNMSKIKLENYTGVLLLLLLNGLLFVVNLADFTYVINGHLPKDVTYTSYVHQGVGLLIFSIILAITIILFFFRNALNFYKKNKWLRVFATLWIIQNTLMVISTISRNNLYIEAYGLTEKRIGVYFYLLLIIIGLTTTLLKVWKMYSNACLIRINSWIFYAVLLIACAFNWDGCIIRYNLTRQDALTNFDYMLTLSDINLPLLVTYEKNHASKFETDTVNSNNYLKLNGKLIHFIENHYENTDWQSSNIRENQTYDFIAHSAFKKIQLQYILLNHPGTLTKLNHLEELKIEDCTLSNSKELGSLTQLKKLTLSNKRYCDISFLSNLKALEYLDISHNYILNYTPLYTLVNLKTLILNKCDESILNELKEKLPTTRLIIQ